MDQDHDNPYAAPKASLADEMFAGDLDAQLAGGVSERELRAYVGSRADRYLRKWRPVLDGESNRAQFNWAAFFLTGLYFSYRKMYRAAFILLGALLVETIITDLVSVLVFELPETPPVLDHTVNLIVAIFCGAWANTWYLNQAKRAIARTRAESHAKDADFSTLARRGGTSLLASIGFLILAGITFIAWATFVEVLAGNSPFE